VEDESGLGSPSENEKLLTFAEAADEQCPFYMSIGVPRHEYWHGDYTQLADYRKAHELRRERANHDAWLQGAYIYDALCAVSPVLNAFAKRGTKPMPYHDKPYSVASENLNNKVSESTSNKTEKELQEIQATNASAKFSSFAAQWNKQFDSKGGDVNGGND
jgi:hypothetical protein